LYCTHNQKNRTFIYLFTYLFLQRRKWIDGDIQQFHPHPRHVVTHNWFRLWPCYVQQPVSGYAVLLFNVALCHRSRALFVYCAGSQRRVAKHQVGMSTCTDEGL
jgi:hypothetical protein